MVEGVCGDRVSCCSTTFWKLLLNDWNFTPHMARPRQSVKLGGVSPFWMMIHPTWNSEWWSIALGAETKDCCNEQIFLQSHNWAVWFCKWWWLMSHLANIDLSAYRKSIIESYRSNCLVEVVQSGQKIKWDLAPPIWHGYEARRTICALQPDNTKQMECCCNTDGRLIMFIWDLGSWIWLLGVKTLSQMDVAPCC